MSDDQVRPLFSMQDLLLTNLQHDVMVPRRRFPRSPSPPSSLPCLLQLSVWYQYDECDIPSPSIPRCDRHRGQCETPWAVTSRKLEVFAAPPSSSSTTSRHEAGASPCSHFEEKQARSLGTIPPLFVDVRSPYVKLVGTGHAHWQKSLLDTLSRVREPSALHDRAGWAHVSCTHRAVKREAHSFHPALRTAFGFRPTSGRHFSRGDRHGVLHPRIDPGRLV
jgi:hypothetical protein